MLTDYLHTAMHQARMNCCPITRGFMAKSPCYPMCGRKRQTSRDTVTNSKKYSKGGASWAYVSVTHCQPSMQPSQSNAAVWTDQLKPG